MALRQSTTAIGNSTTPAATFASATVSGNVLVGLMAMQANRVISASPSGFSARQTQQNTSGSVVTAELADKIADGTETSVTWTVTSGTGWSVSIEEHDDDVSSYDTSAVNASNVSTVVTSQPSGSATNTAADALVIAAFVAQNGNNTDGGRSFTNSFAETTMAGGGGGTARPMALLARKVVSASASQDCTFSTTDIGDEMWGALAIYTLTGGGGGVSGTIASTLAAFTSSITGTTTVVGSAAPALSAFTSSMSGTVTVPGTIAVTLDDSTSSISGSVGNSVDGSMSATLAAFVSAITGTTSVTGVISSVLSAFTSAVQGTTTVVGSMAATLADFTAEMYETVASSSIIRRTLRFARGCFGRKSLDQ